MFFATYLLANNENIGILTDDKNRVIPIEYIFNKIDKKTPKDMNELIDVMDDSLYNEIKVILQKS